MKRQCLRWRVMGAMSLRSHNLSFALIWPEHYPFVLRIAIIRIYGIWSVVPPYGGIVGTGALRGGWSGYASRQTSHGATGGTEARRAFDRSGHKGVSGVFTGRPARGLQCARQF